MGSILAAVLLSPAAGQRGPGELARAFELERAGQYEEAAARYTQALALNPANLSALLGLERVLVPIERLPSIVSFVDSALVLQPDNRSIRSLDLRVWVTLKQRDSLDVAAAEWVSAMPSSPEPYSEWARGLVAFDDMDAAQEALARGVHRLGDASLSKDMAELSVQTADWVEAAQHWRDAARLNPSLLSSASSSLAPAPEDRRTRMVDVITESPDDEVGGRLAADLLLEWDRPIEAWTVLDRVLPIDRQVAIALLRRFADRARLVRGAEGARARGFALERMAQISEGVAAERARIEAARAFVDAGDRQSAERLMSQIATDAESGERSTTAAVATLIGVMAESGRVDEAEARFREWEGRFSPLEAIDLRQRIVRGWVLAGDLDRAESMLGADSSVSTAAVRGWVALYRGNLRTATEMFRAAGPRTGSRQEATARTAMLALIQRVELDSVPELGQAMLLLGRGDSLAAVSALEEAGRSIPADKGGTDVIAFAGRLAVQLQESALGERLLLDVLRAEPEGVAAPAAEYYLAMAYRQQGNDAAAVEQLEHLILQFPESAMLPLARRLFDQIRGGVPK